MPAGRGSPYRAHPNHSLERTGLSRAEIEAVFVVVVQLLTM